MAKNSRTSDRKLRTEDQTTEDIAANRPDSKEPAEGSRENAGGISNRPLSEEQERQENVPARGQSKGGGHA